MKVLLLQENLVVVLDFLQKFIPNKPQLPVLSSVLLETKGTGQISLSATDLYLGISSQLSATVEKEGVLVVPGKIFRDTVANLSPGKVELEFKKGSLTITSESNVSTIQCQTKEDFPEFPKIEGQETSISQQNLEKINSLVGFSASIDQTRPVLTSLLFEFGTAGLMVVGTDGFRLATLVLQDMTVAENGKILIPAKALAEIARISSKLGQEEVVFNVSRKLKQVFFIIGDTTVFVRLIDGEFPPFNKIIPTDYSVEATIDAQELETHLKRAMVFARDASNIIRFQLKSGKLVIKASSPTFGEQQGSMEVEMKNKQDRKIAFNARYLLEFLATVKTERVEFFMNESLTPAMIRPEGEQDYRYIVMPFRVNE